MPTSVEDQLRRLGDAYDDFVDDISVDEVVAIGAASTRTGRRAWLLPAAVIVLVIAGVVAVALVARSNRSTSDEGVPLDGIPSGLLPDGATLQASVDTEVGRFELYEHPEVEQRCLYLRTEAVAHGGCWPNSVIATGQAAASLIVDGRRVVFGVLRPSDRSRAALQVGTVPMEDEAPVPPDGARTVDADENGIWFIIAEDDETHFVAQTDCCQTIGPIPAAPNEPSVTPATATQPNPLDDLVQPDWVLRGSVDTQVGRFEIYDVVADGEVCINHTSPSGNGGSSGCHDVDEIAAGRMWGGSSEEEGAALWGLAPVGAEFRVTVAGVTVVPNALGFWFTLIEENVSEFTIEAPCCTNVIPVGAPMITIPGSTTDPGRPTPVTITEGDVLAGRQRISIDGARTGLDGRSIEVFFVGAAEYDPESHCTREYVPTTTVDSATDVEFVVDGIHPPRPPDDGGVAVECVAMGFPRTLVVPLDRELGRRNVTLNGEPIDVLDVARPALPGELPAGWSQTDLRPSERAPEILWERSWAPTIDGCVGDTGGATLLTGPADSFFTIDEIGVPTGTIDVNGFAAPFVDPGDGFTIWLGWQAFDRALVLRTNRPCREAPELTVDDLAAIARSFLPPPELTDLLSDADGSVSASTPVTTEPDVVIESPLGTNPFGGVRTSSDGRTLLVWFIGAEEYEAGNHCTMRYVASVATSPNEIVLTVTGERPARVADFGCDAAGHSRFLSIPLAEPLGGRSVVFEGEPVEVVDGATLLEPGWVPDEWTVVLEGRGFLEAPTWFREWQPPVFGRCADGLSGLTLFEGPSPFIADFAVDGRERDLGTFDINGSPGQVLVFPTGTAARLAWTTGDRDHIITASLCGDDEERSIASLLRFALDLSR